MVRAGCVAKLAACCLVTSVVASGCGRSAIPTGPTTTARAQLRAIGKAYLDATGRLERPPQSKEELMPDIKLVQARPEDPEAEPTLMNPADVLRSPHDGEEFVIHWGIDLREINLSGAPSKLPVLAYEKHGKDGKRLVLQVRDVREVTDEQLADLPFPRGTRAP